MKKYAGSEILSEAFILHTASSSSSPFEPMNAFEERLSEKCALLIPFKPLSPKMYALDVEIEN